MTTHLHPPTNALVTFIALKLLSKAVHELPLVHPANSKHVAFYLCVHTAWATLASFWSLKI